MEIGTSVMDLNTASRHQLKKEFGKHIGKAIYDLQDEGPIYVSSLVEVTDIGADYWLEEVRAGVIYIYTRSRRCRPPHQT